MRTVGTRMLAAAGIAAGVAWVGAFCVREAPGARALRRLRRARAASENGRYGHSRPPQWREGRSCCLLSVDRRRLVVSNPVLGLVSRRLGGPETCPGTTFSTAGEILIET